MRDTLNLRAVEINEKLSLPFRRLRNTNKIRKIAKLWGGSMDSANLPGGTGKTFRYEMRTDSMEMFQGLQGCIFHPVLFSPQQRFDPPPALL